MTSELIDGTLATIGTDDLPYVPEETAKLLRDSRTGHDLELLQRVLDALLDTAVAVERVGR